MKFDVIVVLAGGITSMGTLPQSVMDRVHVAKKMYQHNAASKILMSGRWSSHWEHFPPSITEAGLMREYAISLGIPKKSIHIEEHSQNTFENALYVTKLFLEPNNWKKVLIITSDFHIPRATRIFTKILGSEYYIRFAAPKSKEDLIRKIRWYIKEHFLSRTQGLLQNLVHRK